MDTMAIMTDDELNDLYKKVEIELNSTDDRTLIKSLEVEMCYVKREVQMRRMRRDHHDTYLRQLDFEDAEMKRLEDTLPAADLDNSSYTNLYNTWN